MKKLEPRQERFCREYVKDLNGTQAAIRAGYSERTANEQASRLLTKASVKSFLQKILDEKNSDLDISSEWILKEIRKCAAMDYPVIKHADKLKGLELLGKYQKLFTEKHEHTGKDGEPLAISVVLVKPGGTQS